MRTRKRTSKFNYKPRNTDEVKNRAKQDYSSRDGFLKADINIFTPKEGDNYLRILPPTWNDPQHYGLDIYVHYQIGADKGNYLCLSKMQNKPCPICEEMDKALKENDEDYAKELKSTKRVLMYMIDRSEEEKDVFAWPASWTIDRDICLQAYDDKTGETLLIDDPEEGYDVTIRRVGKGMNTKYPAPKIDRHQSTLEKEEWLEFIQKNPLPEILHYFDYEHIAKVFKGISQEIAHNKNEVVKSDTVIETYEDLLRLDEKQLDSLAEELRLDVLLEDYDDIEGFRRIIAKEMDIEMADKPRKTIKTRNFREKVDV